MEPVKGHTLPPADQAVADAVREIRRILGLPRKPITQPELQQDLVDRFGAEAPSLRTVKRWEQEGRISTDDLRMLAAVAGCAETWILSGSGVGPRAGGRGPGQIQYSGRTRTPSEAFISETALAPEESPKTVTAATAGPMVGNAVARAITQVIQSNELETPNGREVLANELERFADELDKLGCNVNDIYKVVIALREGRI